MFASRGFLTCLNMWECLSVLINPSGEVMSGFTNVMGIIYHIRFKISRIQVFKTNKILNFLKFALCYFLVKAGVFRLVRMARFFIVFTDDFVYYVERK